MSAPSGNPTHDNKVAQVLSTLQAVVLPANPTTLTVANPPPTAVAVKAAAVTFHTAVVTSAVANNVNPTQARIALHELGLWV